MGLVNAAWLEIDDGEGNTATFEFREVQTYNPDLEKAYLIGDRGQYIQEINKLIDEGTEFQTTGASLSRRTGKWLDGGAGNWQETIEFEAGLGDLTWGDGSGGTGPNNVVKTDASGADVKPIQRLQILTYYIAQTRSDSFLNTRLHIGEWTDGSVDDYKDGGYVDVDAGAFNHPMPIAIGNFSPEKPEDDPSSFTATLTYNHVSAFPFTEEELGDWARGFNDLTVPTAPTYMPDA